jgi:hypothetical protein
MVKNLLEQLRTKVENASGLPDATKSELLKLVAELESRAARTGSPEAGGSNAGTSGSTEGQHGLHRLISSVEGLEASHPDITDLANRIATILGNMGI